MAATPDSRPRFPSRRGRPASNALAAVKSAYPFDSTQLHQRKPVRFARKLLYSRKQAVPDHAARGNGGTPHHSTMLRHMEDTRPQYPICDSPWSALEQELDAWGESGRSATFWWRDDDATRPGPSLDRLLDVRRGAPLSIAAIPAFVQGALVGRLARENHIGVIQHGYNHRDFAPAGARKSEFPPGGEITASMHRLAAGRRRLASLFGSRFTPVLAPPWNRIDPLLARQAGRHGWRALSGYGAATERGWINAHLDPIDWRGGRGFVGEAAALDILVSHLRQRRRNAGGSAPPSGLLTHHRDIDPTGWRFIEMLVERIHVHPAARWVSIDEILADAEV